MNEGESAIEFQQDIGSWEDLLNLEISKHELHDILSTSRVLAMILEVFLPIFIIIYALHDLFRYMGIAIYD